MNLAISTPGMAQPTAEVSDSEDWVISSTDSEVTF